MEEMWFIYWNQIKCKGTKINLSHKIIAKYILNKKSSCKRIHIVWYSQYLTDDYKQILKKT